MNSIGIDFALDHEEFERDFGQVITYSSVEYPAVVSVPTSARQYEADGSGYYVERILDVSIRISQIGNSIAVGEKITFDGIDYRVQERTQDSGRSLVRLHCIGEAV